jgi:vacuolar-type H+-ATPase subunit I/STV1
MNWNRKEQKKNMEFKEQLSLDMQICISKLVQVGTGTTSTWVHPRVAIYIAQCISARFAVSVTGWILELFTFGDVTLGKERSNDVIQQEMLKQLEGTIQIQQEDLVKKDKYIHSLEKEMLEMKMMIAKHMDMSDEAFKKFTTTINYQTNLLEDQAKELGETRQELGETRQELGETRQELGETRQELHNTHDLVETIAERAIPPHVDPKLKEIFMLIKKTTEAKDRTYLVLGVQSRAKEETWNKILSKYPQAERILKLECSPNSILLKAELRKITYNKSSPQYRIAQAIECMRYNDLTITKAGYTQDHLVEYIRQAHHERYPNS